jgi:molybdopterin-guanine dinucleotide biosynthesis protein A
MGQQRQRLQSRQDDHGAVELKLLHAGHEARESTGRASCPFFIALVFIALYRIQTAGALPCGIGGNGPEAWDEVPERRTIPAMVHSQLSGFVLAGGKSTRMGQDKAALTLNGRTLLEHALAALHGVCRDVSILGRHDLYGSLAPVYEDIFPGCGPLGGIHAALSNSQTQFNLIIAVDTPFLVPEFLSYLAERAITSAAVVTTPEIDGYTQPLCTVYSLDFLTIAERALRLGNYKIVPLFPAGRTLVIKQSELRRFAFAADMFENLNTPEDLARARRRFSGQDT